MDKICGYTALLIIFEKQLKKLIIVSTKEKTRKKIVCKKIKVTLEKIIIKTNCLQKKIAHSPLPHHRSRKIMVRP